MSAPTSSHRARRDRARVRGPWAFAAAAAAALVAVAFGGCGLSTSGTAPSTAVPCSQDAHCDDGNPCTAEVCGPDGACVSEASPDGPTAAQIAGDCLTQTCVGGEPVDAPSQTDVADDDNDCTFDTCLEGEPRNTVKPTGTACFEGEAQGTCQNGDCAVTCGAGLPPCDDGNACTEDACDTVAGQCVFTPRHGVPPLGHTEEAGDCGITLCVDGSSTKVIDDADLPITATDCDEEFCNGGIPMNPPLQEGTTCADGVCNGQGECVECNSPTDCTALPPDDECQQRSCMANVCHQVFTDAGTPLAVQTEDDCRTAVCNGTGGTTWELDAADYLDDGKECTTDSCTSTGQSQNIPDPQGTTCGQTGMLYCDTDGDCVGCNQVSDCGPDELCGDRTCNGQQCGWMYSPPAPLDAQHQTAGDCQQRQCSGSAATPVTVAWTSDVPADDGNPCTIEICNGTTPEHEASPANTPCNQNGGSYCDSAANCVQCNMASQCPAPPNACLVATCIGNTCGFMNVAAGTPTPDPTPGDCKRPECDGMGNIVIVAFSVDLPNDNNQCTADACMGGTPTHTPASDGTTCSQNGGQVCSGGVCKKNPGQNCAAPGECASGFCTDGRCCNAACTGDCVSCNNAAGQCTNVTAGQQDTCAQGSVCNSMGACRKTNGQACANAGECLSNQCADGVCCNNACDTACRACNVPGNAGNCVVTNVGAQDLCAANNVCDATGACKLVSGQACSSGSQCASGNCIDGVCCNTGCGQACYSCNVAGSVGTCSPNGALVGQQDTCSAGSVCIAGGTCRKSNGQSCSASSECVSNQCVDGVCCNTACTGACQACDVTGNGTCAADPELNGTQDTCTAGQACNTSGQCTAVNGDALNGTMCGNDSDCASGFCTDGVCCNADCGQSCHACNATGLCVVAPTTIGQDDGCPGSQTCNAAGVCQ